MHKTFRKSFENIHRNFYGSDGFGEERLPLSPSGYAAGSRGCVIVYVRICRRTTLIETRHACQWSATRWANKGIASNHSPLFNPFQCTAKEVKIEFSHTRYRALGPELIPVYRQLAHRWLSHLPGGRLPLLSARPAVTSVAFTRWYHTVAHIRFQLTTHLSTLKNVEKLSWPEYTVMIMLAKLRTYVKIIQHAITF